MKPKKRQKLCHNCDGEIDLDVIVCPFCAADLRENPPEESSPYASSFASLQTEPLQPLYPASEEETPKSLPSTPHETSPNNYFPIILFLLGSQLFFFGFFTLLFSQQGKIHLEWSGSAWFWCMALSLPLLYAGYTKSSS